MALNGSGTFTRPVASYAANNVISSSDMNTEMDGMATALSTALYKDGQQAATANQPMGGFAHTNVAVATARTMYPRASQVADGALTYGGVAGGTADALTIALSPAITAYVIGQQFQFKVGASPNTTAATLNVNSVGSGSITWPDGTALAAGDLPANAMVLVEVQATTPVFHLQTQTRGPGYIIDGTVTDAKLADMTGFALKGQLLGSGVAPPVNLTQAQALAGLVTFVKPGHRLSLTTAVSATTSDVTATGTIYCTPDQHNITPIYNGSAWVLAAIAEKSFILDTGNHLSGKNYDVFLDYNAGTPRIVTGPAWSSDTARADAISRDATYGWYVNTGSMTARISNNGGTVSIGAGAGLYLGTFRCTANGQTEDSLAKRFVWNAYNRVQRAMRVIESADWNYTTQTLRQANANTANQLDIVCGLVGDPIEVDVQVTSVNSSLSVFRYVNVGVDSTTAASAQAYTDAAGSQNAGNRTTDRAMYSGYPSIGRHYYAWLEISGASGTATWYGNPATSLQSGIFGRWWS